MACQAASVRGGVVGDRCLFSFSEEEIGIEVTSDKYRTKCVIDTI
jgi:hypothetical protein